ncbi:MAG: uL14 family ribosomal protein, partial [Candidatus Thermoplasmatota archaeon]|nr:uL14 family ribosomal protein [Candidatus Thermoplasmatota archaeon]
MMRGIAGKQTRGLPTSARLNVADNTGAKIVQILNILKLGGTMRRYPAGGVGDIAKVSVKKGTPETRRQMFNAVIIRQKRPFRRVDGTWVQFEDNACVITNEKG